MTPDLHATLGTAVDWPATLGTVFTVLDQQDSGNVSFGVDLSHSRLFVKCSTTPAATATLHGALRLHRAVQHPAIVAPVASAAFADGSVAVVHPWHDGEVLSSPRGHAGRAARFSAWSRFRVLPQARVRAAIDTLLAAHVAVEAAGFVAVDLYDASLLYDFRRQVLRLVDLDEYRPGPFVLDADRLPGSSRFMAPEELVRGARIDTRTTVFVLGRAIRLLLDATDTESRFRGTSMELDLVRRATAAEPGERYGSVVELAEAWEKAQR